MQTHTVDRPITVAPIGPEDGQRRFAAAIRIVEALMALASERPGLHFGDYASPCDRGEERAAGVRAYRADQRACARALADCRALSLVAYHHPDRVCEMSQRADLGRVEIVQTHDGNWNEHTVSVSYCAGQYYPTEYRRAIASLLADWWYGAVFAQECASGAGGIAEEGGARDRAQQRLVDRFGRAGARRMFGTFRIR